MAITEMQRSQFSKYTNENRSVFSDRVIQDFFQHDLHIELLLGALEGNESSREELENRFRKHFFRVRFIHFVVSTIRFKTIDQLRSFQKYDYRNPLVFDRPASEEGEATVGELLLGKECRAEEPVISNPRQFEASFTNEQLARAFSSLSEKQQLVTTLCYAMCYQDNEVARMIGVTPQAVCKTRKLALKKLRLAMPGRG